MTNEVLDAPHFTGVSFAPQSYSTPFASKYLNNLIEQDHRGIKSRTSPSPILGFKNFVYAAITIAGVELLHRIRKDQLALHRLRLKDQAAPAIWNAVLAA
jgi:transposase-like protein